MLPSKAIALEILRLPYAPRKAIRRIVDGGSLAPFAVSVAAGLLAIELIERNVGALAPRGKAHEPWQDEFLGFYLLVVVLGSIGIAGRLLGGRAPVGKAFGALFGGVVPVLHVSLLGLVLRAVSTLAGWALPIDEHARGASWSVSLVVPFTAWVLVVTVACLAEVEGFSLRRSLLAVVVGAVVWVVALAAIYAVAVSLRE